jgi:ketosteroid isomerase-like protein
MPSNREIVAGAFTAWMNGDGYVASIFADTMTWEITGRSAAAGKFASAREFADKVLTPFAARFSADDPFRPITIRAVYDDGEQGTVVIVWDGRGTTTAGTPYENTYAWIMRLQDGKVVDGTAFFDSIAFNELWELAPSAAVGG